MSLSLSLKGALQQPVVLLQSLLLPLILLALWQYNSGLGSSHAYAFVPLQHIYFAFLQLLGTGELWLNTWGSLRKAGLGFLLGSTAGLILGTLLAYSKILNALVSPLFNSIRQIPLLGLTPLIALWFGNGEVKPVRIQFYYQQQPIPCRCGLL